MKKFLLGLLFTKLFATPLGNITSLKENDDNFFIYTDDGAITKLTFYRSDIFRIWVAPKGDFTDPASNEETPIVVYNGEGIEVSKTEYNDYYQIESDSCILKIYKNPCTFSLYDKKTNALLFKEEKPIVYGKKATKH